MKKPAKRKVVTSQGSRFTECAACGEHYTTLLHASCPSCSPDTRAPAHTPALSSPESVAFLVNPGKRFSSGSSFDSVAFLVNPGKYFSSGVWIEPHLTIVFPPLHGSWAWCPKGLGVINLTLPMSAGPVLASGGFASPTPVEFFHVSQHTARSLRCSLARGVYKELVARYAAVVLVEEAQPLYAPEHKKKARRRGKKGRERRRGSGSGTCSERTRRVGGSPCAARCRASRRRAGAALPPLFSLPLPLSAARSSFLLLPHAFRWVYWLVDISLTIERSVVRLRV